MRSFSPVDLADLIAVFDTGSMAKAAEQNQRTKPAVSLTISRLERVAGFPILERPSYNVKFTPQGEALVVKARAVMAELASLSKFADVLATGAEPTVSLAIDQAVPEALWLPVVKKITDRFPDTQLEVLSADGDLASELLHSERAHAALLIETATSNLSADLERYSICDMEFVDVCKVGMAFHGQDRPKSLPRIMIPGESDSESKENSRSRISVSNRGLQLSLILAGLGWGRLPVHFICDHLEGGKLIQFSPPVDMPFHPVITVCRAHRECGPVAQFLWNSLMDLR